MTSELPPEITLESDGAVRIVTLNNPAQRNALPHRAHDAFTQLWTDLAADTDCRAVILTGAGSAFCAGGDIPGFIRSCDDPEFRRASMRTARRLVESMLNYHVPVIAAVNGPAVGLGASIVSLCDIVLMAENAYLADTHVSIGLVAGDGGAATWPLMMSILRAKEYLFTGERIPALTAVEVGLANRVVASDQLLDNALGLARRVAAAPPQAVQETKRAVNLHLQRAATTVLPFALSAESESFTTAELRATVATFRSKATAEAV